MAEIKFKRDTAFRKQFFAPDSFAHPAKMDAQLLIWIVERYTKVGETILDPMAGSGTALLACGLGRNVVLVELEEKFCKMCMDNWGQVRMRPQLGYQMGGCRIVQGDARNLEGLLVDEIITSPPHGNRLSDAAVGDKDPQRLSYRQALNKVDKIVTSPPYGIPATSQESSKNEIDRRIAKGIAGATITDKGEYMTGAGKRLQTYSDNPTNIGNLPYGNMDAVVTSPPYEASVSSGEGPGATSINRKNARASSQANYSDAEDNIGNLKGNTYLEAMYRVYSQCHKALKPNGLMILVTKNFIRNKQVVRLDLDTIELCTQARFGLLERHYRELPAQSFWRVIYHQKHPGVELINKEDILVFRANG